MANILVIAKYSFFVAIFMSAGVVIERITGITHWSESAKFVEEELIYNDSTPLVVRTSAILDEHYLKCILEPSKPFCLVPADKRLELLQSELQGSNIEIMEGRLENITSNLHEHARHLYRLLVDFTRLMTFVDINTILIEPSMLFCLLTYDEKYNLLNKGFNRGRIEGSRDIVTFAIFENDSKKLLEADVQDAILYTGFKIMKVTKLTKSWTWTANESEEYLETAHYFFTRQEIAVHVVVFYRRNSYLWHAGLNTVETDFEGLLFVNEQILENFTPLSLNLDGTIMNQTFIPNDLLYFLREVESSSFLECRVESHSVAPVQKHPFLTHEKLKMRAAIALRELKMVLAPQMVIFWLWSETLLGWLENCNIVHYSTELQLSLTSSNIKRLDLTQLFADNEFLKVQNNITDSEFEYHLDCHGLIIRIYIMQEQKKTWWYKYTDGQSVYRLTYPAFKLCSTDIFGQKVNVPCDRGIFSLENKLNWTNTEITSQSYEKEAGLSNVSVY